MAELVEVVDVDWFEQVRPAEVRTRLQFMNAGPAQALEREAFGYVARRLARRTHGGSYSVEEYFALRELDPSYGTAQYAVRPPFKDPWGWWYLRVLRGHFL